MTKKFLASTSVLIALAAGSAFAQDKAATPPASPAVSGTAITAPASNQWRSTKLIGLDVYNNNDEKIGDISELLLDSSGKIDTVVIGVGGFLGLGQTDVAVKMDQLKFVNEPIVSKTAATTSTSPAGGGAAGGAMNSRPTGAGSASTVGASTTTSTEPRMYPDHAVFNATKEQLKAMPQFKYSQDTGGASTATK